MTSAVATGLLVSDESWKIVVCLLQLSCRATKSRTPLHFFIYKWNNDLSWTLQELQNQNLWLFWTVRIQIGFSFRGSCPKSLHVDDRAVFCCELSGETSLFCGIMSSLGSEELHDVMNLNVLKLYLKNECWKAMQLNYTVNKLFFYIPN